LPREINPDIPPGLEAIIMKAMNPDLKQRYSVGGRIVRGSRKLPEKPGNGFLI
jgi:hypothetical protein